MKHPKSLLRDVRDQDTMVTSQAGRDAAANG